MLLTKLASLYSVKSSMACTRVEYVQPMSGNLHGYGANRGNSLKARVLDEWKDILTAAHDSLKVPKKILRKMARVQYKQNFETEVAESKEFEALFEGITNL